MFDQASIELMINRIGFGVPESEILGDVTVSQENMVGTSGRTFRGFHQLVTLGNIYETTNEPMMNDEEFNAYLNLIKIDAIKSIGSRLLIDIKLCPGINYSDLVLNKPELFEDAYGYAVAYACIEQMISTTRSNNKERNAKMAYQQLKIELEGMRNDNGYYVAQGISNNLTSAINIIADYLCPNRKGLIIEDANCW